MATKTKPPKRKESTPATIRKWLKERGHATGKVDALDLSVGKAHKSLMDLHKAGAQEPVIAEAVIAESIEPSRPPWVDIGRFSVPLSSQWTWDHVLQPVAKFFGGGK